MDNSYHTNGPYQIGTSSLKSRLHKNMEDAFGV